MSTLSLTHSQDVCDGVDMMAVVSSTPATSKDDTVSVIMRTPFFMNSLLAAAKLRNGKTGG